MASILLSITASALSKFMGDRKEVDCAVVKDDVVDDVANQKGHSGNDSGNLYSKEKSIEMRYRYICSANKLFFKEEPLKIVRGMITVASNESCQLNDFLALSSDIYSRCRLVLEIWWPSYPNFHLRQ